MSLPRICVASATIVLIASAANAADKTATSTAIAFPEEGGPLPRAEMPEGGTPSWREPPEGEEGKVRPPHSDRPIPIPQDAFENERHFRLRWRGYLRVIAEVIENDALLFVGRNDGFRLDSARLELTASYGDDLRAVISIDGALAQTGQLNDPNAVLQVGLRDAFMEYDLSRRAGVRVGRFKAPYDISELESTELRAFIDPPIESRGVQRTQGFETLSPGTTSPGGMSQKRELGAMLHRSKVGLSEDGFDFGYAVALTNGYTGDRALNDSDTIAAFVRLSLLYADWLSINAAGFMDTRTAGELPNLLDTEVWGAEGSFQLAFEGLRIEAQFLLQRVSPTTAGTGSYNSMGTHAQWTYRIWSFEPGYRFAWYEPNSAAELDVVFEHTIGISYYPGELPLRLTLNGTFAQEQRSVNNNRIAFLVQYTFE